MRDRYMAETQMIYMVEVDLLGKVKILRPISEVLKDAQVNPMLLNDENYVYGLVEAKDEKDALDQITEYMLAMENEENGR